MEQLQPPPSIEMSSLSAEGSHFFVDGLHVSFAGQSVFVLQPTHCFEAGSQTGLSPGHWLLVVQVVVQVPVFGSQNSGDLQSLFDVHSTHLWVCGLQIGMSFGHTALVWHGPHVPVVGSQTSGGVQFAFVVHSTHLCVVGLQIGVSCGHCWLVVQLVVH